MAKTGYSYEDFVKKAQSAGLLDSFSQADLRLARQMPEAGLSILSFKQDYNAASTDEARALANAGAEQIRRRYGGYLGGVDGLGYDPVGTDASAAEGQEENKSYVNKIVRPESSAAPLSEFYQQADRLWDSQRREYLREGARAYQNSLGEAAANTGGVASTAAVAAAQQAQNYYGAKAADAKQALYQQAYENWLAERGLAQSERELSLRETESAWERESAATQQSAAQSAAQSEAQQKASQQQFDNAMAKWKAYGYVTADIADILALPVGTVYAEQGYNEWKQAFEEAKSGVKTNLTQYDSVNQGERVVKETAADHSTLSYGANSLEVKAMQEYLITLGYSCGSDGADGKFGTATHRALLRFQKDKGVYADGVCGPVTWTALLAAAGV